MRDAKDAALFVVCVSLTLGIILMACVLSKALNYSDMLKNNWQACEAVLRTQ